MPPPRISESAEAARAAALQAEFNEKKWVWVPDEKEGYLGGWVVEEQGDIGEVVMATNGDVSELSGTTKYFLKNSPLDKKSAFVRFIKDESTEI